MDLLIDNRTDLQIDSELVENLERAIKTALNIAGYGDDYEVSFSVVSQEEIRELNRDYRGKDSVTDVLSFPVFEPFEVEDFGILGDIVICYERALEQAIDFGHSIKREIIYLTVHSTLHLLGYDHMEDEEKLEMRRLEKEIMDKPEVYKDESKGL